MMLELYSSTKLSMLIYRTQIHESNNRLSHFTLPFNALFLQAKTGQAKQNRLRQLADRQFFDRIEQKVVFIYRFNAYEKY